MLFDLLLLAGRPLLQDLLAQRAQLVNEELFGIISALELAGLVLNHIKKRFKACAQGRVFTQSFFQVLFVHGKASYQESSHRLLPHLAFYAQQVPLLIAPPRKDVDEIAGGIGMWTFTIFREKKRNSIENETLDGRCL